MQYIFSVYLVPEVPSWGKEQLEHDVDHFSSSNAKIKNDWS